MDDNIEEEMFNSTEINIDEINKSNSSEEWEFVSRYEADDYPAPYHELPKYSDFDYDRTDDDGSTLIKCKEQSTAVVPSEPTQRHAIERAIKVQEHIQEESSSDKFGQGIERTLQHKTSVEPTQRHAIGRAIKVEERIQKESSSDKLGLGMKRTLQHKTSVESAQHHAIGRAIKVEERIQKESSSDKLGQGMKRTLQHKTSVESTQHHAIGRAIKVVEHIQKESSPDTFGQGMRRTLLHKTSEHKQELVSQLIGKEIQEAMEESPLQKKQNLHFDKLKSELEEAILDEQTLCYKKPESENLESNIEGGVKKKQLLDKKEPLIRETKATREEYSQYKQERRIDAFSCHGRHSAQKSELHIESGKFPIDPPVATFHEKSDELISLEIEEATNDVIAPTSNSSSKSQVFAKSGALPKPENVVRSFKFDPGKEAEDSSDDENEEAITEDELIKLCSKYSVSYRNDKSFK